MSIGEIIYTRRKALNMTQKDLAQKLNITDRTVSRWECGQSLPDVAMLKTVAEVLNMDVIEFYSDVPINEINKTEPVDYERIDQYKRGQIIPFLLLFAAIVALPILKLNYADMTGGLRLTWFDPEYELYIAELYRKTCVGYLLTLSAFVCSLSCQIYEYITFRRFYISKKSNSIYADLSRRVNIVYIILAVIYIFLFLIAPSRLRYILNGGGIGTWRTFFWKLL
jgi:transcriptional regulator with XRE-family HTH domain